MWYSRCDIVEVLWGWCCESRERRVQGVFASCGGVCHRIRRGPNPPFAYVSQKVVMPRIDITQMRLSSCGKVGFVYVARRAPF